MDTDKVVSCLSRKVVLLPRCKSSCSLSVFICVHLWLSPFLVTSQFPHGHGQPAAEVFPVPGVVELSGVVVIGQHASMPRQRVHQAGVSRLGVPPDIWVDVL